jgi:hypothetical protein
MNYLKSFSTCLVALALTGTAWAEIYETKDAQGNPVFTDSPAGKGSQVVDLPETNVADAPPDIPDAPEQAEQKPQAAGNNNTVNGSEVGEDYYGGDNYDRAQIREELDRKTPLDRDAIPEGLHAETPLDPSAPHEVLDGEVPHQVGDFDEPQRAMDRRVIHDRR